MSFLWPFMLPLLMVVPLLLAAYIWMQRRRKRYALRYASLSLVKDAVGKGPGRRRHLPPALFLVSLAVMIVALARPVAAVQVPGYDGELILAIDVSGSMAADDITPNRMEAAKEAARDFVKNQPDGVRIGVVSFSDNAMVVQAPTDDQDAVVAAINRLRPQRGTAIGRALLTSLQAIFEQGPVDSSFGFNGRGAQGSTTGATPTPTPTPLPKGAYAPAVIVLLSDGQNNQPPSPADVVGQAADRGVRVYTIGLGTEQGAVLRTAGRAMLVRLDERELRGIAEATDGEYFSAASVDDLRKIYNNLGKKLSMKTEQTELTVYLTGLAALLSLAGAGLSLLWFSRLP